MRNIHFKGEEDLLIRIRQGDDIAFELIFYRYKGKLFDFFKRNLPVEEDAEEIVQDVFFKLWINRNELDPSKSLKGYIYTIARNELFGYLRKSLTKRKYLEELYYSANPSANTTEKQIEFKELQSTINNLINKLPPKCKNVFLLSREKGLSYKQIGRELGISENTVDTHIRKALTILKKGIREKFNL